MSDHGGGQRQCRRGVTAEVELGAALALADMAGAPRRDPAQLKAAEERHDDEEESTRLSLELGRVSFQSSSCSSSSSAGRPPQQPPASAAAAAGHGPRPRHILTEAEKEAKRLRRVLANRESARQTILRRQAIRDELARRVSDLSSENESMMKEKETVIREYLSLKETNKQLKEQVARTAGRAAEAAAPVTTAMAQPAREGEAAETTASAPPLASFVYTAPPRVVPVPYMDVWGSWPPPGCERGGPATATFCLPPCAWYHPAVAADPRGGSPTSHAQPFQEPASGGGGTTAEEDTDGDDDQCSLTLALDVDKKKSAPSAAAALQQRAVGERQKAAQARKRRKKVTKLKQTLAAAGCRPGGDHAEEE